MGFGKRIRNIAVTQLSAIKERLDRIDEEAEDEAIQRRGERDALRELNDPFDMRKHIRSPEDIAAGVSKGASSGQSSSSGSTPSSKSATSSTRGVQAVPSASEVNQQKAAHPQVNPLSHHYKVLGIEEGADLSTVQSAYQKLVARCAPERFPDESEEQKMVTEIRKRVDVSYQALRDTLDPTAGRFDKLEF